MIYNNYTDNQNKCQIRCRKDDNEKTSTENGHTFKQSNIRKYTGKQRKVSQTIAK